MLLDCLSLLQWEVFQFCNVFKVVASCSLFFFMPFLNNPELLDRGDERKPYVYVGYTYDILPQIRTQINLRCIHDAYTED